MTFVGVDGVSGSAPAGARDWQIEEGGGGRGASMGDRAATGRKVASGKGAKLGGARRRGSVRPVNLHRAQCKSFADAGMQWNASRPASASVP